MKAKLKAFLDMVDPLKGFVGLLITLLAASYGAVSWINKSAREAVLDEKFLAILAARIRPSCIFDSNGAIEADLGAGEYVGEKLVVPDPKDYGYVITIKSKKHLAYAPLVMGIDVDLLPQSSSRSNTHDWQIKLAPNSTVSTLALSGEMDIKKTHRFRLEILH